MQVQVSERRNHPAEGTDGVARGFDTRAFPLRDMLPEWDTMQPPSAIRISQDCVAHLVDSAKRRYVGKIESIGFTLELLPEGSVKVIVDGTNPREKSASDVAQHIENCFLGKAIRAGRIPSEKHWEEALPSRPRMRLGHEVIANEIARYDGRPAGSDWEHFSGYDSD